MSIDEMNGMIRGYKQIKDFCKGGNLTFDKKDGAVYEGAKIALDGLIGLCDDNISKIQENIDGEIERMYEMMEGKKDDRQDHRDVWCNTRYSKNDINYISY